MPRGIRRAPLLALGVLSLLGAMWGGLVRLGWELPPLAPALVAAHGPLMVTGFLGTVISLERAVALGRRWPYLAPLASGLGALALIAGAPWPSGALLVAGGSLVLCAVFAVLLRRQPTPHMAIMGGGAVGLFVGNALWAAGWGVAQAVPWWMAFVVLTIAGERLELARLRRLSRQAYALLVAAITLLLAGAAATILWPDVGMRLAGAGMIAVALWLLRNDLALRVPDPRNAALGRFMARALRPGYLWLAVSGVLAGIFGAVAAGPHYDALLHSLFLGFTFSMILAHAPVIFPVVLGTPLAFRAASYVPLALLQGSLVLRIAGDLLALGWLRQWGGMLNVVALLLFLAITIATVLTAASRVPQRQAGRSRADAPSHRSQRQATG